MVNPLIPIAGNIAIAEGLEELTEERSNDLRNLIETESNVANIDPNKSVTLSALFQQLGNEYVNNNIDLTETIPEKTIGADLSKVPNILYNSKVNPYNVIRDLEYKQPSRERTSQALLRGDEDIPDIPKFSIDAEGARQYYDLLVDSELSYLQGEINEAPDEETRAEFQNRYNVVESNYKKNNALGYVDYVGTKAKDWADFTGDTLVVNARGGILSPLNITGFAGLATGYLGEYVAKGGEKVKEFFTAESLKDRDTYGKQLLSESIANNRNEFLSSIGEAKDELDSSIHYQSYLMNAGSIQDVYEIAFEVLGEGSLLTSAGKGIGKGMLSGKQNLPLGLPAVNVFGTFNKARIDEIDAITQQSFNAFKQANKNGVISTGWKKGTAAIKQGFLGRAGAYGDDVAIQAETMDAFINTGVATLLGAQEADLVPVPDSLIGNFGLMILSGIFGHKIGEIAYKGPSGVLNSIALSTSKGNYFGQGKYFEDRLDRKLINDKDIPEGIVTELNKPIDNMPAESIPEGVFKTDPNNPDRYGYLLSEYLMPRKQQRLFKPQEMDDFGNVLPLDNNEIAYRQAQAAFNKKMEYSKLSATQLKRDRKFFEIFRKIEKSNPEQYETILRNVNAVRNKIDGIYDEILDPGTKQIKPRYRGVFSNDDVEAIEVYFDNYLGTSMFGQFTEALQTSADLGFFGNKLNSLFANDYIEMLGVQERNIDKLTNLHNGLLQKITKIEDSNGKEFLEGVMEELTTGRNNQIETYEKNLSYINTEVAKANAIIKNEVSGFDLDNLYDEKSILSNYINPREITALKQHDNLYTKITGATRDTRKNAIDNLGIKIRNTIDTEWDEIFAEGGSMEKLYDNFKTRVDENGVITKVKISDADVSPRLNEIVGLADKDLVNNQSWKTINSLFAKAGFEPKRTYTPEIEGAEPINIYVDKNTTMEQFISARSRFKRTERQNIHTEEGHVAHENAEKMTNFLNDSTLENLKQINKEYTEQSQIWKSGFGREAMMLDNAGVNVFGDDTIADRLLSNVLTKPEVSKNLEKYFGTQEQGVEFVIQKITHDIHMGKRFDDFAWGKIENFLDDNYVPSSKNLPLSGMRSTEYPKGTLAKDLKDFYTARKNIEVQLKESIIDFGTKQKTALDLSRKNEAIIENIIAPALNLERRSWKGFIETINDPTKTSLEGIENFYKAVNEYNPEGISRREFDDAIAYGLKNTIVEKLLDASQTSLQAADAPKLTSLSPLETKGITQKDKSAKLEKMFRMQANGYEKVIKEYDNLIKYVQQRDPSTEAIFKTAGDIRDIASTAIVDRSRVASGKILNVPTMPSFSKLQSLVYSWNRGVIGTRWLISDLARTHMANANARLMAEVLTSKDSSLLIGKLLQEKPITGFERIKLRGFILGSIPSISEVHGEKLTPRKEARLRKKRLNSVENLVDQLAPKDTKLKSIYMDERSSEEEQMANLLAPAF